MAGIIEAQKRAKEFFTKEFDKEVEALRIMEVSKTDEGWNGRVEVTETNIYLKKQGYPPVYDKNVYSFKMDEELNVVAVRQEEGEEEE